MKYRKQPAIIAATVLAVVLSISGFGAKSNAPAYADESGSDSFVSSLPASDISDIEESSISEPTPPPESSSNPSSESKEASSEKPVSSKTEYSAPTSQPAKDTVSSRPPPSSSPPVVTIPPESVPQAVKPALPEPESSENGKYVVGYYSSWARSSGLPPNKVAASMLTHLNYAFASVNAKGELVLPNPATDRENFKGLRLLKQNNPHLKTLISVGGWDYSKNFSSVASSASARKNFAQSCISFILEHGFDGVDIDWEFPGAGDRRNFTLLLQEVRNALDQQAAQDNRSYYLTIAGSPSQSFLNNIEPEAVASLVDYIFIMGYDLHGPWDKFADFNAPLYPSGETTPHYAGNLSESVTNYKNVGIPGSKIILGMPFYGYGYTTDGSRSNGYFSPFSSAKSIGYDKLLSDFLGNPSFNQYFHENSRIPYMFDGSTFISYDDESSIAEKASFAMSKGLAGVGAWELSHDKSARLLASAYNTLNG